MENRIDLNQIFWMNALRSIAMFMIITHNWCTVFFKPENNSIAESAMRIFLPFSGSFVQIFFIISGSGLVFWMHHYKNESLIFFYIRRFKKIVLPYWIAIILFYFVMKSSNFLMPSIFTRDYDFIALLKYLLFLQNQFPDIWYFNNSFWFMPIIISLYIVFPWIVYIQKKMNDQVLLFSSIVLSIISMVIWESYEFQLNNLGAIFPFFLPQFTIGMLIGKYYLYHREYFNWALTKLGFTLGFILYMLAFIFITYVPVGYYINDIFSALGLFLITINSANYISKISFLNNFVLRYSSNSYVLYLTHLFIISYLLKQCNDSLWKINLNPCMVIIIGIGFNIILLFIVENLRMILRNIKFAEEKI